VTFTFIRVNALGGRIEAALQSREKGFKHTVQKKKGGKMGKKESSCRFQSSEKGKEDNGCLLKEENEKKNSTMPPLTGEKGWGTGVDLYRQVG